MANNFTRNPWTIDTASANYLRSGTTTPNGAIGSMVQLGIGIVGTPYIGKGPISISHLVWSGYTTGAADNLVIKDVNGVSIYNTPGRADKTFFDLIVDFPWVTWDLAVTTLSSGLLTIMMQTGR